jgi:hypothetical protein
LPSFLEGFDFFLVVDSNEGLAKEAVFAVTIYLQYNFAQKSRTLFKNIQKKLKRKKVNIFTNCPVSHDLKTQKLIFVFAYFCFVSCGNMRIMHDKKFLKNGNHIKVSKLK